MNESDDVDELLAILFAKKASPTLNRRAASLGLFVKCLLQTAGQGAHLPTTEPEI